MKLRELASVALALMLSLSIFTSTLSNKGCSTRDVQYWISSVDRHANKVIGLYHAADPDSPRAKEWQGWLDKFGPFARDFSAALTQEEQIKLLPTLNAVITAYTDNILAKADGNNLIEMLAAYALDEALRWFADQIKDKAAKASNAERMMGMAAAQDEGVDVEKELKALDKFLKSPKVDKPKEKKPDDAPKVSVYSAGQRPLIAQLAILDLRNHIIAQRE